MPVGRVLLPRRDASAYFTNAMAGAAAEACERFNDWFGQLGASPSLIKCAPIGSGMRLGVLTEAAIPAEAVYLGVPLTAIMSAESAHNDSLLGPVLRDLHRSLPSPRHVLDPNTVLMLHLLVEAHIKGAGSESNSDNNPAGDYDASGDGGATVTAVDGSKLKPDPLVTAASLPSKWAPYLDLLPQLHEMLQPLLWTAEELGALQGSAVASDILHYKEAVDRTWQSWNSTLLPALVQRFPAVFAVPTVDGSNSNITGISSGAAAAATVEVGSDGTLTSSTTADVTGAPSAPSYVSRLGRAHFLWAHAIIDSRSIWWDGQRHLVPMLDLINAAEGPTKRRVHSTVADDSGRYAVTKADRDYGAGDQLFENYGQPNHIYLTYHGFSYPGNGYDCVRVDVAVPPEARTARLQTSGPGRAEQQAAERRRAQFLTAHLEEDRLKEGWLDADGTTNYPILYRACLIPGGAPFNSSDASNLTAAGPLRHWPNANALAAQATAQAFRVPVAEAVQKLLRAVSDALAACPTNITQDLALLARDAAAQVLLETSAEEDVDASYSAYADAVRGSGVRVPPLLHTWRGALGGTSSKGGGGGGGGETATEQHPHPHHHMSQFDTARSALLPPRVREAVRFRLTQKALLHQLEGSSSNKKTQQRKAMDSSNKGDDGLPFLRELSGGRSDSVKAKLATGSRA